MKRLGSVIVVAMVLALVACSTRQPPMSTDDFHDRFAEIGAVDDAWVEEKEPIAHAVYYFAYVQLDADVTPEQLDGVLAALAELPPFDDYHVVLADGEGNSMEWAFDSGLDQHDGGSAFAIWDARGHLPAGTRLDVQGDPGEAKYVHAWLDAEGLEPEALQRQGYAFINQASEDTALSGYDLILGDVFLSASATD